VEMSLSVEAAERRTLESPVGATREMPLHPMLPSSRRIPQEAGVVEGVGVCEGVLLPVLVAVLEDVFEAIAEAVATAELVAEGDALAWELRVESALAVPLPPPPGTAAGALASSSLSPNSPPPASMSWGEPVARVLEEALALCPMEGVSVGEVEGVEVRGKEGEEVSVSAAVPVACVGEGVEEGFAVPEVETEGVSVGEGVLELEPTAVRVLVATPEAVVAEVKVAREEKVAREAVALALELSVSVRVGEAECVGEGERVREEGAVLEAQGVGERLGEAVLQAVCVRVGGDDWEVVEEGETVCVPGKDEDGEGEDQEAEE
jgi:hypothetical protein